MLAICCRIRIQGGRVGRDCRVERGVQIGTGPFVSNIGGLTIGDRFHADIGAIVFTYGGNITIGDDVYVGPYSVIYGHGDVEIGAGTVIAMGCQIVSSNHAIPDKDTPIRSLPDVHRRTSIGADCWLGGNVSVLGGVSIGTGCVIGAGAVVTHDLPPHCIAVGVPAKISRFRDGAHMDSGVA